MRLIIGSIFLFNFLFSQGFLHVDNGDIVDGTGAPILLKGLGLGGWLVPEGYMLNIPGYGSPTEIENKIEALLGTDLAAEFWDLYHENYVAEADVDQIAEWGFNSIRIPFHYKQFSPSPGEVNQFGYDIVDSLLSWCTPYNMYIILDMHCAPGGQNHGEISDSDGTARLWLEDGYKEHTIEIWHSIAEYYADETLIGGYDLINEPVLPDGISSEDLRELYIDITNSIREVDTNHLLFIEGNWYGTDFTSLTPPWDDNMSYSFHKYWNDVTQGTIQYLINMSGSYDIPLWLGETGENSNHWGHEVIQLCESNGIGWNWWTHKKLEKITSPLSAIITPQYQDILDYWNGNGSEPSQIYAQAALFGMANNLLIENCERRPGVIPALMDPAFGETPIPVTTHSIPGTIAAVDYDIGARNVSYTDTDYMNTGSGSYNLGWSYRNDGVDIQPNGDENGLPYNVGWTDVGEWIGYTIENVEAGAYDIEVRVAALQAGGLFFLQMNGNNLGVVSVPSTGGWFNWETMIIEGVELTNDQQYLKLQTVQAGYNVEGFTFIPVTASVDEEPIAERFKISQPFPNPFNPSTTIKIRVNQPGDYSLNIFDLNGKMVIGMYNGALDSGEHSLKWDGVNFNEKSVASGVYLLIISDGKMSLHKKLVLMR
ncbi:MAG: cellulase family glycosylhydrolase [Candidatus Neomarinimicrobiota bacterium]|nr:cellulase family glycosylhydrolase [Candidatus Neomarinimicrobiota bacterium]